MPKPLFHLAFPVHDLAAAKKFYLALGCRAGRASAFSAIFQLGDHQIVAQLIKEKPRRQRGIYPRHFGLIFGSLKEWQALERRARRRRLTFYQEPKLRFSGTPLEHRTFFLEDPSLNLLEFKFYSDPAAIFGKSRIKKIGDH